MDKKPEGESFREYKKRVIDPIGPSFCAAKWHNATIWLGHGQTTSCHQPPMHDIPLEEVKHNHTAIHNTKHKKEMRKLMLNGERPAECGVCWKMEDSGKDVISVRVQKTQMSEEKDIAKIPTQAWDNNSALHTLEISFDRACNFKCSYCNPAFSTAWVKDINDNGPYQNIQSDTRGHFVGTAPWAEKVAKDDEDNPYIQAFWKWWEEPGGLVDTLYEIRVTGGEPIMHPGVWKLFDWFKNNPTKGRDMIFSTNSNLVPEKEKTFEKLLEITQYVPNFKIYTSCEAVGKQADYIRDGMKYDTWLSNISRLLDNPKVCEFHVMMTINSLCLDGITDFMDDMLALREIYGERAPVMSLNRLDFPTFQSPDILPEYMLTHYHDKLETWYEKKKDLLIDVEHLHVQNLLHHLTRCKTRYHNPELLKKQYNDFKTFYTQYDARRGFDFRSTFDPMMVEWFDSLEIQQSTIAVIGPDPATVEKYNEGNKYG